MLNNKMIFEIFLTSLALSVGWNFYHSSALLNFIDVLIMLLITFYIGRVILFTVKKEWALSLPSAFSKSDRIVAQLSTLNAILFNSLLALASHHTIPTIQNTAFYYRSQIAVLFVFVIGSSAILWFSRHRPYRPSIQVVMLICSCVLLNDLYRAYTPPGIEHSVVLETPLNETFHTLNGGHSRLNNAHMSRTPQRYLGAYITTGERFATEATDTPEERFSLSFGKTVYACASGTVHAMEGNIADTLSERADVNNPLGNFVTLLISPGRYLILTNLKQHSILVKPGDTISAGQPIAQIGLSALLSECMLAILVCDSPDVFDPTTKSLPFYFRNLKKLGDEDSAGPFFPSRNDVFVPVH